MEENSQRRLGAHLWERVVAAALFAAFFLGIGYNAQSFGTLSKVLPLIIGWVGGITSMVYLLRQLLALWKVGRREPSTAEPVPRKPDSVLSGHQSEVPAIQPGDGGATVAPELALTDAATLKAGAKHLAALLVFIIAFNYVEWRVAILAFVTGYFKFEADSGWLRAIAVAVLVVLGILAVALIYPLNFPRGLAGR